MLDRPTAMLEIASRVLEPGTIRQLKASKAFSTRGWRILDRWALNTPDELKRLEKRGYMDLFLALERQIKREVTALDSPAGRDMEMRGVSEWEIFSTLGVEVNLTTSR